MTDLLENQLEERYKNRWYGKYRAFVRDHHDPERLGRCRLEIPSVLGTGEDNWSDWASPCFPYGGNDDVGCFMIPPEGASVWAEFEGGHVQYPIWVGVWLAKSNPGEQPEESKELCDEPTCSDCMDKADHTTNSWDNLEHKKYHGHPPYYCPHRKVLLKTKTGHTILADDKDEHECLRIIDRSGQIISMVSPVKSSVQTDNSLPRGTKTAEQGNQLDIKSEIKESKAHIQITDLARQVLRLEAWQDKEKIHILSGDATRSRWQKILLDTSKGHEKVHIWGLNGTQEIVIDSSAGKEKIKLVDKAGQAVTLSAAPGREGIKLTDKAGSQITMDGLMGNIMIRAVNKTLINT